MIAPPPSPPCLKPGAAQTHSGKIAPESSLALGTAGEVREGERSSSSSSLLPSRAASIPAKTVVRKVVAVDVFSVSSAGLILFSVSSARYFGEKSGAQRVAGGIACRRALLPEGGGGGGGGEGVTRTNGGGRLAEGEDEVCAKPAFGICSFFLPRGRRRRNKEIA